MFLFDDKLGITESKHTNKNTNDHIIALNKLMIIAPADGINRYLK